MQKPKARSIKVIKVKTVLIVCDGMGDRLKNGKTPLEEAFKPNMDEISKKGINGIMDVLAPGIIPGSDTAHLALFGYDPYKYYTGRGPFEALGAGIKLGCNDIAFRCNFGTVKNGVVIDRRAGRDEYGLDSLSGLLDLEIDGVKTMFKKSSGHRGVLVLKDTNQNPNLSEKISGTDPEEINVPVKKSFPLNGTPEEERASRVLNKFTEQAYKILEKNEINQQRIKLNKLPANVILARGPGKLGKFEKFEEKYGLKGACVAGVNLIKGVARAVGLEILEVEGANGHIDSNIKGKVEKTIDALKEYSFVFMHIKGTDEISHDGNFEGKVKMIEKIDKEIGKLLDLEITLALTADHSTPVTVREHTADPVPIAISGDVRTDLVETFGERSCARGDLGRIRGMDLMRILFDISNKSKKFGA